MSGIADAPWVGKTPEEYYGGEEKKAYCFCDVCGEVIYEGEEYYKIGEDNICTECVSDAKTVARG